MYYLDTIPSGRSTYCSFCHGRRLSGKLPRIRHLYYKYREKRSNCLCVTCAKTLCPEIAKQYIKLIEKEYLPMYISEEL